MRRNNKDSEGSEISEFSEYSVAGAKTLRVLGVLGGWRLNGSPVREWLAHETEGIKWRLGKGFTPPFLTTINYWG